MIRNNTAAAMFQSEMEDLELDLNLGPSDLLFADDLLNLPLESFSQQGSGFAFGEDNVWNDAAITNSKMVDEDDLLEKIIKEVQLPREQVFQTYSEGASCYADDSGLFEDDAQLSPASNCSSSSFLSDDSTQTLIDEMEEFLVKHELKNNSEDEDMEEQEEEEDNAVKPSQAETAQAEKLLDALMRGDISMNDSGFADEQLAAAANLSGGINNISEVITEDGQRIIIVITNDEQIVPSPSPSSPSASSSAASTVDETSDSEWSPGSPPVKASQRGSRKRGGVAATTSAAKDKKIRGPYKRSSAHPVVKDKKERKKLQNVVAARRYRDKKKSEQSTVEQEEQELVERNVELKSRLAEMESEVKTLKKLMLELGLVKVKA